MIYEGFAVPTPSLGEEVMTNSMVGKETTCCKGAKERTVAFKERTTLVVKREHVALISGNDFDS
ncbi:MAG: hypothetical protein M3456_01730 [Actinomycetota bacterium]|nr:hypothetical protein [Actinomycetota bacterium]